MKETSNIQSGSRYAPTYAFWVRFILGFTSLIVFGFLSLGFIAAIGALALSIVYLLGTYKFANSKYGKESYLRNWYFVEKD